MRQTRLTTESADYLAARERLRLAEIELMRQREWVRPFRFSRVVPWGAAAGSAGPETTPTTPSCWSRQQLGRAG